MERKDLDPLIHRLDLLIENGRFINEKNIAALYALRAKARQEQFFMEWQLRNQSDLYILKNAMKDWQTAIDTSDLYNPLFRYKRLQFVRKLFHADSLYSADSTVLVQHGWKNGFYTGVVLGACYVRDNSNWLGLRISAWGKVMPSFTLVNLDSNGNNIRLLHRPSISYQFFSFQFLMDVERDKIRYGLSAVSFTKPFYFDPCYIGLQETSVRPGLREFLWYYRPSFGYSWSCLTLGYGFFIPLDKGNVPALNRHEVFLLATWPLSRRPL